MYVRVLTKKLISRKYLQECISLFDLNMCI